MYVREQTRPYILANSELYTPKVLPPLLLHDGILCGFKITDNAIPITQGQKRLAIIRISSAEGNLAGCPLDILAE